MFFRQAIKTVESFRLGEFQHNSPFPADRLLIAQKAHAAAVNFLGKLGPAAGECIAELAFFADGVFRQEIFEADIISLQQLCRQLFALFIGENPGGFLRAECTVMCQFPCPFGRPIGEMNKKFFRRSLEDQALAALRGKPPRQG
ncbi:MAG: hypothetical protein ACD_75C01657G0003, partial [uncultured bacterium]